MAIFTYSDFLTQVMANFKPDARRFELALELSCALDNSRFARRSFRFK